MAATVGVGVAFLAVAVAVGADAWATSAGCSVAALSVEAAATSDAVESVLADVAVAADVSVGNGSTDWQATSVGNNINKHAIVMITGNFLQQTIGIASGNIGNHSKHKSLKRAYLKRPC